MGAPPCARWGVRTKEAQKKSRRARWQVKRDGNRSMGKEYSRRDSSQTESSPQVTFAKMMRTPDVLELIEQSPLAFTLAAYIAYHARYSFSTVRNLAEGEALIGNPDKLGMTRQQYRTAIRKLVEWQFATIKTSRNGTVAKLTDSRLFHVLMESTNGRKQPTANHQATKSQPLTKNDKKEQNGKNVGDRETGGEGRPCLPYATKADLDDSKPSKPLSVSEVVSFALPRCGFETSDVAAWVAGVDFKCSACELLAIMDDDVREAMKWAFRFIHYNNTQGWRLRCSWQAAFDGFLQKCDHGCGPADVPHDWIPHIAGEDETPNG